MRRGPDVGTPRDAAVVQCTPQDSAFGYVYAIGQLGASFPSKDVEKEFQQLLTNDDRSAPSEEQRLYNVLSRPENLFLAREMAWVFYIEDVATYVLEARSSFELEAMIQAIKPDDPTQTRYDVIIGVLDPGFAPASPGEDLPRVTLNRLYHFTAQSFASNVPLPPAIANLASGSAKDKAVHGFRATVLTIFQDMLQLADNTGDADEHRALNYVSLSYPDIYAVKWSMTSLTGGDILGFTGVDVRRSPLGGARKIYDVIFSYATSSGLTSHFYTSVDVTGQFPFLVTKLQPYFER